MKIDVSQSDGSDGYNPGTWRYVVTTTLANGAESTSGDGGFSTRDQAAEEAQRCEATLRQRGDA